MAERRSRGDGTKGSDFVLNRPDVSHNFKTATCNGLRFHARSLARTRDPSLPPPRPTRSHALSGASGRRRRVAVRRTHRTVNPIRPQLFPNKPYFQLIGSGSIQRAPITESSITAPRLRPRQTTGGHTRVPRAGVSARRAPSTSAGRLGLPPSSPRARTHSLPRGPAGGRDRR